MYKNLIFVFAVVFAGILLVSSFSSDDYSKLTVLQDENGSSSQLLDGTVYDDIGSVFQNIENSELLPMDYANGLIAEIANDSSIYDIVGFSIGMVVYGIFVYHFYRFLSKRDMFCIDIGKISKAYFTSSGKKHPVHHGLQPLLLLISLFFHL